MNRKIQYIQPNYHLGRNEVAIPNYIWSIDDVKISFVDKPKKLAILFVLDLYTREVLDFITTKTDFDADMITKRISHLLISKNISATVERERRLIINTDRDTHFCCKTWAMFGKDHDDTIVLSMSNQATPKYNACSERLNRTARDMKIKEFYEQFQQDKLKDVIASLQSTEVSEAKLINIVTLFVKEYNEARKHRYLASTPTIFQEAYEIVGDRLQAPEVPAARNSETSTVEDRVSVQTYRQEVIALSKKCLNSEIKTT